MAGVQSLSLAGWRPSAALYKALRAWAGRTTDDGHCADSSLPNGAPPADLRVLLAGGGPSHQRTVAHQLGLWGIEPVIARHGEDAARLATARHFDIILMDGEMPVMYGFAAATRIREHERTHPQRCRVPIIAWQGSSATALPALLQQRGIDAVLRKSCHAEELRACLQRWCRGQGDSRESPALRWTADLPNTGPGAPPCTR